MSGEDAFDQLHTVILDLGRLPDVIISGLDKHFQQSCCVLDNFS